MREFIKDAYVRGNCPSRKKIIFSKGKKNIQGKKTYLVTIIYAIKSRNKK